MKTLNISEDTMLELHDTVDFSSLLSVCSSVPEVKAEM